jgi:hypothetical protein
MDSDSVDVSGTAGARPVKITRGWVAPESPQGDCANREVWVQALNSGSHGLIVRVAFDYDETNFVEHEWSAAQIASFTVDGRYTVVKTCEDAQARAVKVTLTSVPAAGVAEHFQPLGIIVTYGVEPGLRRRTLFEGAIA